MYQHILVPLENSPTDQVMIDHVRQLARFTGARLTLVHVADGHGARNFHGLNLEPSSEMIEDRAYLDRRQVELSGDGFVVDVELALGEPADQIVAVGRRTGCDLIAMATHGHRLLGDIILGSVADAVRHRTDIPVLLIRAPKKK